jgi:hypothetical protein
MGEMSPLQAYYPKHTVLPGENPYPHTFTVCGRHALVATFPKSSLIRYLETYLGRHEHWLQDWWNANNVSKSTAVFFAETARRIQKPRAVQFLGETTHWVETARYLEGDPLIHS